MKKIEIDVDDYLNHEEIKEIVAEQLRAEVKNHFKNEENAQRLLSNLSYKIVFDEVDKFVPNSRNLIVEKTIKVLQDKDFGFSVFRSSDHWSKASLAYSIMEEAVKANKSLIEQKVKDTIENKDYSEDIWSKFEELGDTFISNIYEIVRLGRQKQRD